MPAQDSAALIEVNASVDTSGITIGDRITYTISLDYIENLRIEQPGPGANLGQFEIKNYNIGNAEHKNGRILQSYEYVISVFDTGSFIIPAFPVAYFPEDTSNQFKIIETGAIPIKVRSVINDDKKELRDIKPPLEIPFDYYFWSAVAAILILLGIAGFLGYRFYQKRKETGFLFRPPAPPRPAHEIAIEALDTLLRTSLLQEGQFKLFYSEISEIIRRYIEGRYFVPALEQTSREILQAISQEELKRESIELLGRFLSLCDLVKFAKYIPDAVENQNVVEWSRNFIEETKIVFQPKAEIINEKKSAEKSVVEHSENSIPTGRSSHWPVK